MDHEYIKWVHSKEYITYARLYLLITRKLDYSCGLCFIQLAEVKAGTLGLRLPERKANWKDSHLCKSPSVYTNRNALWVYAALCRLCIGYFGAGVKKGIKANFQEDDLIQENGEAAGVGFHLRHKKKILNMDLKEGKMC